MADDAVLGVATLPATTGPDGSGGIRFTLETDCLADECQLVIEHGDGSVSHAPVNVLGPSRLQLLDDVVLRVIESSRITNPEGKSVRSVALPRNQTTVNIQRRIDDIYATMLPLLALSGLIGVVASILQGTVRRRDWALIVIALSCGIAVLSRIGLIGLLEVSAWGGALRMSYLAPASPFMLTFAVLGVYLLIDVFVELLRSGRARTAGATT